MGVHLNKEQRKQLVSELVDEVTKDASDLDKVKILAAKLNVEYADDPIQFLNNVLKGIHFEEGPHV